ncbi:MAG: hypothetical protein GX620_11575 [Chloroflexi bacterium]|nr:hypothetical protein [Chloroflexota bacterium]
MAQCVSCAREIPGDALLCPYCGQSVHAVLAAPAEEPAWNRPTRWRELIGPGLFFSISLCCCLAALGMNLFYDSLTREGWVVWDDRPSIYLPRIFRGGADEMDSHPTDGTPGGDASLGRMTEKN